MDGKLKKQRILLKLSGEALMGEAGFGISPTFIASLAEELRDVHQKGVQMALVVGGGNIFRGISGSAQGMERSRADHMGMLATVMNALALASALEDVGVMAVVQSALLMPQVAEPFSQRQAVAALELGQVVIFAAGTGNPYFTTDTAASLRAAEIHATLLLKGTKVDGVYDRDPVKDANAQKFDRLTYQEVQDRQLRVMDQTAIALCRENSIPIRVFSMQERGVLAAIMDGASHGTLIGG